MWGKGLTALVFSATAMQAQVLPPHEHVTHKKAHVYFDQAVPAHARRQAFQAIASLRNRYGLYFDVTGTTVVASVPDSSNFYEGNYSLAKTHYPALSDSVEVIVFSETDFKLTRQTTRCVEPNGTEQRFTQHILHGGYTIPREEAPLFISLDQHHSVSVQSIGTVIAHEFAHDSTDHTSVISPLYYMTMLQNPRYLRGFNPTVLQRLFHTADSVYVPPERERTACGYNEEETNANVRALRQYEYGDDAFFAGNFLQAWLHYDYGLLLKPGVRIGNELLDAKRYVETHHEIPDQLLHPTGQPR
jgi:hypothetical protein